MEIPYQTSLAESKYHGANSLKTLRDPLNFILNPHAWECKAKVGTWLCRDAGVGRWWLVTFLWVL